MARPPQLDFDQIDLTQIDLMSAGKLFLPTLLADPAFIQLGVLHGSGEGYCWTAIDPVRHPLFVWQQKGRSPVAYGRTARSLDAALFTNGPLMGKRIAGLVKITRPSALVAFLAATALSSIVAFMLGRRDCLRGWYALAGAIIGAIISGCYLFSRWLPCGIVHSTKDGIHDSRDFDQEGATHAWFGRNGMDFASYHIGTGDLPAGMEEGSGGLLLLVKDFAIPSLHPRDPSYHASFARIAAKRGIVAWALLPTGQVQPEGVLVVVGSEHKLDGHGVATLLCEIGARDAVAVDQSAAVMMGSGSHFFIGPPPPHRQSMQRYGLCCQ